MIADRRAANPLGDGHKTGPSHDDVDPDETNPDGLKTTGPIRPPRSNADLGVGVAQAGRELGELRLRGRRVDITEKQDRLVARDRAGDGRANPGQGGVASCRVEPDWQSHRSEGDGGGQRVHGEKSDPSERPVDDSLEPGRSMFERDVGEWVDAEQAEPEHVVAPEERLARIACPELWVRRDRRGDDGCELLQCDDAGRVLAKEGDGVGRGPRALLYIPGHEVDCRTGHLRRRGPPLRPRTG